MSGHSKWSTIKRQKGVADIKKGQSFTKLANAITIAVKLGSSGDPDTNPRLRMVIDEARSLNMPKDNIARSIERGLGKGKEALEEVTYEGFGPGHTAFIVEGVTDNRLRTNQEIKAIFERNGGSLAGQSSISYMFEKKGEIKVTSKASHPGLDPGSINSDSEMLELIDLGAEDIEDYEENGVKKYLIYTEPSHLNTIGQSLVQAGFIIEFQDLIMKPTTVQKIEDKIVAEKVIAFADKLEDADAVQKVFSNFDIAEGLL